MPSAAACYHCGSPNPRGSSFRARIAGSEREFCCGGCRALAQMLDGAGLSDFYARRTSPAPRAPSDSSAHAGEWDDPVTQARVVRRDANGHCEASLLLDGIQCSACAWLIETWLARQRGVVRTSVNYATRRASVTWDPSFTRLSALLDAVQTIGYAAHPYDPVRREALVRREGRTLLARMAIAVLAMMQVMMFALPTYLTIDGIEPVHRRLLEWASLTLTLPSLLYCAAPFFRGAWRDLSLRRAGMDVPVAIGLIAAFSASVWATLSQAGVVYYDSVTMFVALLLVARYVEFVTRRRAGDMVESIARARPALAERILHWPNTRETERVAASALRRGDVVLVRPGSIVPADGIALEGQANVEEALLTGESKPRVKARNDVLLAGSMPRDGALVMRITAAGDATQLAAIERLVERASAERPAVARVADRIAQHFVRVLLVIAVATAAVWALIDSGHVLTVAFAVLAVSCPCALSLATPAAIAACNSALSRLHVVVTRADALETLARVTHVVFDKTGTLTRGDMRLLRTRLLGEMPEHRALALAAALEGVSEHPIARAIRQAGQGMSLPHVRDIEVVPGRGVEGVVDGTRTRIGSFAFVAELTGTASTGGARPSAETEVALGNSNGVIAVFSVGDEMRPGARGLVQTLAAMNVRTMLLSGDRQQTVDAIAASAGIVMARGDASPYDKRDAIKALQAQGAVVAMIGDGINDAPALAQANVSLCLASGTPLAQWAADVVVLGDDIERIGDAFAAARNALRIVRQNLAWAFGYNALAIPAAAFGFVTPLAAAIGMSISSIVVVLNAARAGALRRSPKTCAAPSRPRLDAEPRAA